MQKFGAILILLTAACGQQSGSANIEDRATARLSEKLQHPEYLQVRNVRAIDSGTREKLCGTVSYTRSGVPSAGAERFAVMPGIVAIEGQPTTTFTFEYLYEHAGCAA